MDIPWIIVCLYLATGLAFGALLHAIHHVKMQEELAEDPEALVASITAIGWIYGLSTFLWPIAAAVLLFVKILRGIP